MLQIVWWGIIFWVTLYISSF